MEWNMDCVFLFFYMLTVYRIIFIFRFDHTPLATPNGDVLIKDLSFEVKLSEFMILMNMIR